MQRYYIFERESLYNFIQQGFLHNIKHVIHKLSTLETGKILIQTIQYGMVWD